MTCQEISNLSEFYCQALLKLKLRMFITDYTVSIVTCYVMTITYLTRTGHLFDTIILALTDKGW